MSPQDACSASVLSGLDSVPRQMVQPSGPSPPFLPTGTNLEKPRGSWETSAKLGRIKPDLTEMRLRGHRWRQKPSTGSRRRFVDWLVDTVQSSPQQTRKGGEQQQQQTSSVIQVLETFFKILPENSEK